MTEGIQITAANTPAPHIKPKADESAMRQKARELEANFLTEMLGHAGFDAMDSGFGGGIGEEQFNSFLREAYAQEISEAGGIGLAESIFQAMSKGENDVAK